MPGNARTHQGWLVFALVLATSVVLLGTTVLNVALPAMQKELRASNDAQQWILNAYTLTFAGFLLVSGVVGDRFGYRRVLIGALGLFAVTAAIGSVADNVVLLVVMRALMGIGAAGILPVTLAIVNDSVPVARRATAITIWAACSGLSIALGPLLGGVLLSAGLWWGSVMALVAVLAAVSIVATAWFVPGISGSGAGELRVMPVLGSVAGVGLLVWGVLNGGQNGQWVSVGTLVPLISGLVVLAVLVVTEARHDQPMADVRLFIHSAFTVSIVVLTVGTFSIYGF
jgi:MFS family permease